MRLLTLAIGVLATSAAFAETRNLTIASSHPTTVPWVGTMKNHVQPELNARLKAQGSDFRIEWTEGYGGALYKLQDTLEAVETGLADIGWVGTLWEPAKMPLQQIAFNTPFTTNDLVTQLEIINELHEEIPSLRASWNKRGMVFLGAQGNETYHLFTTEPVDSLDDLKGKKILAPGLAANWLKGTGAIAVDGGLPSYYTQLQTGVADGVIVMVTGAYPFKLYEVAPYMTHVNIGSVFAGGLAVNKDTFESLPAEAQSILRDLGKEYTRLHAEEIMARYDRFLADMQTNHGLTVLHLSEADRKAWIDGLPDLAGQWAQELDAQGLEATTVLEAYMGKVVDRVGAPERAWTN
ncbi:MAG: C4-dicarboxylate TRAP transporter substrate-binding protein [Pseudomonadota bacterium]